jgi:hypothetical protein
MKKFADQTHETLELTVKAVLPPDYAATIQTRAWLPPVWAWHTPPRPDYGRGEGYVLLPDDSIPSEHWYPVILQFDVDDASRGPFFADLEIRGWYAANETPVPVEVLCACDHWVREAVDEELGAVTITVDERESMERRG